MARLYTHEASTDSKDQTIGKAIRKKVELHHGYSLYQNDFQINQNFKN